jgi:hypothetical protein
MCWLIEAPGPRHGRQAPIAGATPQAPLHLRGVLAEQQFPRAAVARLELGGLDVLGPIRGLWEEVVDAKAGGEARLERPRRRVVLGWPAGRNVVPARSARRSPNENPLPPPASSSSFRHTGGFKDAEGDLLPPEVGGPPKVTLSLTCLDCHTEVLLAIENDTGQDIEA